ncbi:MAG: DUF6754 domain-containing protein [Candidatus Latescibacterota bacterium]|nr:DUF6754 domain-containing protein [Candidatus Latescibacterota bacterium]
MRGKQMVFASLALLGLANYAFAQGGGGGLEAMMEPVAPPTAVEAFDTPNDGGGSITLTWPKDPRANENTTYQITIAESPNGPFRVATEVAAAGNLMSSAPGLFGHGEELGNFHFVHVEQFAGAGGKTPLEDGKAYYFHIDVRSAGGTIRGKAIVEARAEGNLFNNAKTNNLVLCLVFSGLILGYIGVARRRELKIRRIAGLEALDEALGRATEMGKPVLFIHGLRDMSQIPTIAAVNILGRVARRTAEYDTALRVVASDPVVMSVSQETVKASYIEAGRPDAFNPDHVFVASTEQFSYAAAVEGIMVRERPAAHIMMGYFYAESLLLAETGSTTGAIQIAGTDAFTQLPFFVTTCDYTLLGEELYAASAYLSGEPRLLGSLKGQDGGKAILLAVLILGTLLATLGIPQLTHVFTPY